MNKKEIKRQIRIRRLKAKNLKHKVEWIDRSIVLVLVYSAMVVIFLAVASISIIWG